MSSSKMDENNDTTISTSSPIAKVGDAIIDKHNLDSSLVYTFDDHEGSVRALAFSPDARSLATVSEDRTARIYDVVKGKPVEHAVLRGHTIRVVGVAFSPESTYIGDAERTPR